MISPTRSLSDPALVVLRQQIESLFADVGGKALEASESPTRDTVMKALFLLASRTDPAQGDALFSNYPDLLRHREVAGAIYRRYILEGEDREVRELLAREPHEGFEFMHAAGDFAQHAYRRVADMFNAVDFSTCRRFVLVGCGALPVTMYHVMDRTEAAEIVGLDVRSDAVGLLRQGIDRFGLTRLQALQADGASYSYQGADIVYVANLVSPKSRILERIADTAPIGVRIVLRDPYSLGRLFTERGVDDLDARLRVVSESEPDTAYFSRHVYIERVDG